jgi:hypothetical protein
MPHKYAALLASKGIANCPCSTSFPVQGLAYRFVELPAFWPGNYIPRGQMPGVPRPRHIRNLNLPLSTEAAAKQNATQCNFLGGLSMFETEDEARTFFHAQIKGSPHFLQTYVAELSLVIADGWATPTAENGHFAFHQSDTAVVFTAVQTQTAI